MSSLSAQTARLMRDSVVIDMIAPGSPFGVLTPDEQSTEEWYGAYEHAGCTFTSCTVAADHVAYSIEACVQEIAKSRHWLLAHPNRFTLVEKAADIRNAKVTGKLAVCLNIQGTLPYQRNLKLVEVYRRLGVLHALVTYNEKNLLGDGCHERTDCGLSRFGLGLVAEMNRVGVLVDVTHAGHRTAMETIAASEAPVIMSHSSPRAIFDHERNVPDDLIVAMAQKGGVIGIQGVGIFMSAEGSDISAQRLFAFLDYSVQLVGANHVGFGLDYIMHPQNAQKLVAQSGSSYARGGGYYNAVHYFSPPEIIVEVVGLMLRKNYSETDVQGILGENWLRVIEQVCG